MLKQCHKVFLTCSTPAKSSPASSRSNLLGSSSPNGQVVLQVQPAAVQESTWPHVEVAVADVMDAKELVVRTRGGKSPEGGDEEGPPSLWLMHGQMRASNTARVSSSWRTQCKNEPGTGQGGEKSGRMGEQGEVREGGWSMIVHKNL